MFKKIFKALQYNYVYYSIHFIYCSTLKFICSTNFKGVTALFVFREVKAEVEEEMKVEAETIEETEVERR